jgi:hypothetical protein
MPATEKAAAEVGRLCELGGEARQLLHDRHQVLPYLHLLMEKKLHEDAVRVLAHALPKREAVWWACQCARNVAGAPALPGREAPLTAAEAWVADPNESNRRAAYQAALRTEFGTPAGCAALAAFFSGGSLGPAKAPAIPPDPLLSAQMAANAALLAAVSSEPTRAPERYGQFLRQGILLARGVTQLPGVSTKSEAAGGG